MICRGVNSGKSGDVAWADCQEMSCCACDGTTLCVNYSPVIYTSDLEEIGPYNTLAILSLQIWYESNFALLMKVIMITNNEVR